MSDLSRFHEAQAQTFATALAELEHGQKLTHWMWFIFPQLASLGRSERARFYGIADMAEAQAYLADPVLRDRLERVTRAVLSHPDTPAQQIMGRIDALKLCSCATLFAAAGGGALFEQVIEVFCAGTPCALTLKALERG